MVEIQLKLFASLVKYLPANADNMPVAEGTTVSDLMEKIGLTENEVKLVFINGRREGFDYRLRPDDRVGLVPAVGGG